MSFRTLSLVVVWALSLVAAVQFGASAQGRQSQEAGPGHELRFMATGTRDG